MPRSALAYILATVAFIGGLAIVLRLGSNLTPGPAPARAPAAPAQVQPVASAAEQSKGGMDGVGLVTLFVEVGLILILSRVVGMLFARLGQPQVMGEIIAGIILGPSLLGWLAPDLWMQLFPPATHSYLAILSQVGIVFFLFLVGLDLDPALIRTLGRSAVSVSYISILAPFLLGAGITLYLYPRFFTDATMPFRSVALFMGAAVSVTAFPVLARILIEHNLHKTRVGAIAIASAAVNDAFAWCILALVVAIAKYQGPVQGLWTAGLSCAYVAAMFLLVRPFLARLEVVYERQGRLSQNLVAVIFLLILASACATQAIGIHALFGAFLMGCIMPKGMHFVRHLSEKLEDYTVVFLLPIFFAYTGLQTDIRLLVRPELWLATLLVIAVACVGKFGGATLAARFGGFDWHESAAIGILMNTRGLMELVILSVGRELHVISDTVFAMMVIMALVTTALTAPLLRLVYPSRMLSRGPQRRPEETFTALIPVALPKSGGPLVQLADTLIGPDRDQGRLFALHLRAPADHEAYRSGLDEASISQDEALLPLLAQARGRGIPVEPLSFISRDVPADIATVAAAKHVNLVLMGFHKPMIGKAILGGTVHRVLAHCPSNVAIFVDRGFRTARRILVPYLGGSQHDVLALELAARMARNTGAQVTVLHVVPPLRGEAGRTLDAKGAVVRVFQEPDIPAPVSFRVIQDPSPVGVVLHQAQQFDLVVIGVAEEWGLESHLFGWRPQRIARDCPCSLLIVRHRGAPVKNPAPAPEAAAKA